MRRTSFCLALVLMGLLVAGCGSDTMDDDYVARVHDEVLTRSDLSSMMQTAGTHADSTEVASQVINQWITNELLYQEAQRRGLNQSDEVQRLLQENERTLLINALVTEFYEEEADGPSEEDIRAYYDRYTEQLRLRQPYVRIQFLQVADGETADSAATVFADEDFDEEAWVALVQTHAVTPDESISLADNYLPQTQVFPNRSALRNLIPEMSPGQVQTVDTGTANYVIHLVDRAESGTIPELQWVEDEITRRLQIEDRKQLFARKVQRLRVEAESRDLLDVRE